VAVRTLHASLRADLLLAPATSGPVIAVKGAPGR